MTLKDKVILGLELCIGDNNRCTDCPYRGYSNCCNTLMLDARDIINGHKMTLEEALERLKMANCTLVGDREALDIVIESAKKSQTNGCDGCVYKNLNTWQVPCHHCRRNW